MNVCDQLPAMVRTLPFIVTEEDSDWVDWQDPEVGAAPETPDRCRSGQVLQLLLVSDGTLQPVRLPFLLRNLQTKG